LCNILAFKVDHTIPPLKIVDVYQIVMNILGVEPGHKHNGTWSDVENMLSDGWESRVEDSSAFSQNTQNWSIFSSLLLSIIILRYL
jgi:hypothetical protein